MSKRNEFLPITIALVVMVLFLGLFTGLFLYAIGAASLYMIDREEFGGLSPENAAIAALKWPAVAWEYIRR